MQKPPSNRLGTDRLAIIDHGKLIAEGSPEELKHRAGEERVTLATADDEKTAQELRMRFGVEPQTTDRGLEFAVSHGEEFLARLGHFPIELRRLSLQKPTLEDAFIALTGGAWARATPNPLGDLSSPMCDLGEQGQFYPTLTPRESVARRAAHSR